jgi:hypothetical protein
MFRTLRSLSRSSKKSHHKPIQSIKNLRIEYLEDRAVPATLVFQDGNNPTDYRGTEDTVLFAPSPDTEFYTDSGISVDQQDANGVRQGMLQFRNIFTNSGEAGKIPLGSTITSATIRFSTFNDSNSEAQISLYRMLLDWREGKPIPASVANVTSTGTTATVTTAVPHTFELGESVTLTGVSVAGYNGTFNVASVISNTSFTLTLPAAVAGTGTGGTAVNNTPPATWNFFRGPGRPIGGVQASEGEAEALPDYTHFDPSAPTIQFFNVTKSLQAWAGGQANYGWLLESGATNGWDFDTSENSLANRPQLTVEFTPPATTGAASTGAFRLTSVNPVSGPEGAAGATRTYTVQVSRIGGSADAVSVDYTVAAGTATAADDFDTIATTSLQFGAGVTSRSFDITIKGDDLLEGLETINIALSNPQNVTNPGVNTPTITSGFGAATLTIADDDALISEVFGNTTDAATEQNRTYIELIGTPNASLAGYQFVVFESEEEENSGTGSGRADLVIDLGAINGGAPATFGSNGVLVITPTAWAFTAVPGTNVYTTTALDGPDGGLEDFSQSYALVRRGLNGTASPIVQGTDYDILGYGINIASITSDGTTATVTTTKPHLFITGNTATIAGTGIAGFDGGLSLWSARAAPARRSRSPPRPRMGPPPPPGPPSSRRMNLPTRPSSPRSASAPASPPTASRWPKAWASSTSSRLTSNSSITSTSPRGVPATAIVPRVRPRSVCPASTSTSRPETTATPPPTPSPAASATAPRIPPAPGTTAKSPASPPWRTTAPAASRT